MDKSRKTQFVFDLYDDDRSGFLSTAELTQCTAASVRTPTCSLHLVMRDHSCNYGLVTMPAQCAHDWVLMASHMQSAKQVAKKVQTIMKQVDADGSGTLSYEVSVNTHLQFCLMIESSLCIVTATVQQSLVQDIWVYTVCLLTRICMRVALQEAVSTDTPHDVCCWCSQCRAFTGVRHDEPQISERGLQPATSRRRVTQCNVTTVAMIVITRLYINVLLQYA
eukprot:5599-Heterococcus_DN1.PRE.4